MTAHLIDKEIRQIIDEQYDRALNILNSNREILAQTAETLLENEVIEGDDLQVLADNISRKIDSDDGSGVIPEHQPLAA
jgi:cell division protease FtsH